MGDTLTWDITEAEIKIIVSRPGSIYKNPEAWDEYRDWIIDKFFKFRSELVTAAGGWGVGGGGLFLRAIHPAARQKTGAGLKTRPGFRPSITGQTRGQSSPAAPAPKVGGALWLDRDGAGWGA